MLLTSSQVSVAVSSGIVILCTTALFLSGYVLQQRTLHDLRSAIAPRPSPKISIPDGFTQPTTDFADGTLIVLDDNSHNNDEGQAGESVVEVRPTAPDNAAAAAAVQQQKALEVGRQGDTGDGGDAPEQLGGSGAGQKPMSRAERRRRIKEEIKKSQMKSANVYRPRRAW